MSYTKQTWANGDIITAAKLNHMEDGIAGVEADVSSLDTKLLASMPHDTASGSIASFPDGAAMPVRDLSVDIEPVQAGSGDPSPDNVRPISGWTEATVTRTGKNLLDNEHATIYNRYIQYYDSNNANWVASSDSASYCISVKPNTSYAIKAHGDTAVFRACAISVDPSSIGSNTIYSTNAYSANASTNKYCVITTGSNEMWLVVQLSKAVVESGTGMVMVELGNTYSDYSPYQGQTYTIDLNGTRYGGTLNVTSGKLTVDRAMVDLGTLAWGYESSTAQFYSNGIIGTSINWNKWSDTPPLLCSRYKPISNALLASSDFCVGYAYNSKQLRAKDSGFTDAATFKTAMSGVQLVYELATPIEVDLDPVTIETLLGTNNIFADCGDTTVSYYADTTLFVNKKIAAAVAALS